MIKKFKEPISVTHPHLLEEWDYEANGGLRPENFTFGSDREVWWICKRCGYKWKTSIYYRAKKDCGCPRCANKIIDETNCLLTIHSELCEEWNYEANENLRPEHVTYGSNKKVGWICKKCEYKWFTAISHRTSGKNCPRCAKQIVDETNCLLITNSNLELEWNYEKNKNLKPTEFSSGSGVKVWWKCKKCDYEWKAEIKSRCKGRGCPNCAGKIVTEFNNILVTHKDLCSEWNYEKNGDLKPENFVKGSHKKVNWICKKCKYTWKTTVYHRTIRGQDCPRCSNKIVDNTNCLLTTHPELCLEWNKINILLPNKVTYGSDKKVLWKCKKCLHEWSATINSRVQGKGCPKCHKSIMEKKCRGIFETYLNENFPPSYPIWLRYKKQMELDGYNEKLNLAFEYDGEYHYRAVICERQLKNQQERDKLKDELCLKNNITLIRIPYWENENLKNFIKNKLKELDLL